MFVIEVGEPSSEPQAYEQKVTSDSGFFGSGVCIFNKKGINIKVKNGIKREKKKNPIRTRCPAQTKFYSAQSTIRTKLINIETYVKPLCLRVVQVESSATKNGGTPGRKQKKKKKKFIHIAFIIQEKCLCYDIALLNPVNL